jgi:uncharacterized membrane protein YoaK (UPF0700 family)
MFRHLGKRRTYYHNLKLASILSAVAGMVNITGVLSVKTLTTNVTGHFAFFSEEFSLGNYRLAGLYLIYTLLFFVGAFSTGVLVELAHKYKRYSVFLIPILLESLLLIMAAFSGDIFHGTNMSVVVAGLLLFAMGLQNALVTEVSQSVVRTTHLTGLFTDLGIQTAELMFRKSVPEKKILRKGINLKLIVIVCFFLGGIIAAYLYSRFQIKTLLLPVSMLLFAMWFDNLVYRFYNLKRKLGK